MLSGHYFKRIRNRRPTRPTVARSNGETLLAHLSDRVVERFARISGLNVLAIPLDLPGLEDAEDPPQNLWKTYIQRTQAESAFRTEKSELHLRPIWHHHQDRVQAHILFLFLAYALWNVLEQWMARSGLGHGPRPVIEELAWIKTNDVILPTSTGREIRIRCVTRADASRRILLSRLGLELPGRLGEPKWQTEPPM